MSSLLKTLFGSDDQSERTFDLESSAGHESRSKKRPPRTTCPPRRKRLVGRQNDRRALLSPGDISLWAWPSRGGVIVLEDPTLPDFEFLALNPLDPPMHRDADQNAEDLFCRELLRLGATWWDSEDRRWFVLKSLPQCDEEAVDAIDSGTQMLPTLRERRWIRVAWPSDSPGSLSVAEYDTMVMGDPRDENEQLVPEDAGRVALAHTMNERRDLLQRLGGKLYANIIEYDGQGFLKAWEDGKHEGEIGSLVKTVVAYIAS